MSLEAVIFSILLDLVKDSWLKSDISDMVVCLMTVRFSEGESLESSSLIGEIYFF